MQIIEVFEVLVNDMRGMILVNRFEGMFFVLERIGDFLVLMVLMEIGIDIVG